MRRIHPQVTGAAEVDEGVQEVVEQRNNSGGMDFWREMGRGNHLEATESPHFANMIENYGVRKQELC